MKIARVQDVFTTSPLMACSVIIVVILLCRYSIEITEKRDRCYSELAAKNKNKRP